MDLAKFDVTLKAYAMAIVTGLVSGYIILFAPYRSSEAVVFYGGLIIGVVAGFIVLAWITNIYDAQIAKERRTEESYNNKLNRFDRGSKLLKDYFLSVETGIVTGAIIYLASKNIGFASLLSVIIFSAVVAGFVVFCYVIIYPTSVLLDRIHLRKRRKMIESMRMKT